eukprot:s3736_g4.t1
MRCNHSGGHAPWSAQKLDGRGWVFDTAAEAECPALMARRLAACILKHLPANVLNLQLQQLRMNSLQVQGRQHKSLQQLVPDFISFAWVSSDFSPAPNQKLLPPKHAGEENEVPKDDEGDGKMGKDLTKLGTFMEPEQHMGEAACLKHPMDVATILPDDFKRALFNLVTKEPAQMAKERLEMLKLYRYRAAALQKQEEELHDSLPVHVQRVVKGKRLLLFEERLQANSFPDMQVMNDFKQGVDLVGEEPYSPLFLEKLQPATMTVRQLDLSAALNRRLVIGRSLADHEKEHADRLVELSQEEVDESFLRGPFLSEEAVTEELGTDCWTLTKRFLLLQGDDNKERIIDDYRRSHVNAAFASRSYLDLQDVDVLAALLVMLTQILRDGPNVEVHLSDGTSLKGRLSAASLSKDALVGRCFDLSKAYKQLAVSKDSLRYSVLGARDNSGQWFFYVGQSLPFGSTSSVYSFNKAARALQFLLWRDFQIVTTNFYDDYPTIDFAMSAEATTSVVSGFFQLLGWRHAVSGKKAKPFSTTFTALGVEYNLHGIHAGSFTIGNKPERLVRIKRLVEQVEQDKKISQSLAASIPGLLNFASGFALGRCLQPAAQGFSTLSTGISLTPKGLSDLCEHTMKVLDAMRPRQVSANDTQVPVIIYTDGAYDGDLADWGAILLDPLTGARLCYSGRVPSFLLQAWSHLVGDQLICQIEMFAVLCIRWEARHLTHGRRVILFIDNEPCRYCLIKGRSPSDPLFRMAHACSCMEGAMPCYPWFERVASYCNPADLPSRRKSKEACDKWNLVYRGDANLPSELLTSILDGTPYPQGCDFHREAFLAQHGADSFTHSSLTDKDKLILFDLTSAEFVLHNQKLESLGHLLQAREKEKSKATICYHEVTAKPGEDLGQYQISRKHEVYFKPNAKVQAEEEGSELKLQKGTSSLAALVPFTGLDKFQHARVLWAVKWTLKGLMPVKPCVCLYNEMTLPPSTAVKL